MDEETLRDILNRDPEFRYRLLSRMQSDCEYYLGNGGMHERHLWAESAASQIAYMKALWESFPDDGKPEWLTMGQIEAYEEQMAPDIQSHGADAPKEHAETVKVCLMPVGEAPQVVEIPADAGLQLEALQGLVGGCIEYLPDVRGDGFELIVNEEGLFTCEPNRAVYASRHTQETGYLSQMDYSHVVCPGELYTILHGPVVAVRNDGEGSLTDITPGDVALIKQLYPDSKAAQAEVARILLQKALGADLGAVRAEASDRLVEPRNVDSPVRDDEPGL